MQPRIFSLFLLALLVGYGLFFGSVLNTLAATSTLKGLEETGGIAYGGTPKSVDLVQATGAVIGLVLGFAGVIFFALVVYGGILWMTAGGKEDQVEEARSILINSAIGILIAMSSYILANFVVTQVFSVTSEKGANTTITTDTPKDTDMVGTCQCDLSPSCENNCECDPDCIVTPGCSCDKDANCTEGCACDVECILSEE